MTVPSSAESSIILIRFEMHYATDAVAILDLFGFSNIADAFKRSGDAHQVWNLLSLEHNIRSKFDHFDLWFESTHQVCYFRDLFVTLTDTRAAGPL